MARFGIWYTTSKRLSLSSIRIAGQRLKLSFPEIERAVHEHELGKILFDDCYKLNEFPRATRTILDVGANVGLFGIAARHHFRDAVIHSYEPNRSIEPHLRSNCEPLGIKVFTEAIGNEPGLVDLVERGNSLHSVTISASHGKILQISFRDAIERLGGNVDLLKLDCEGAEWSLFEDRTTWLRVRNVTMEYHLWANPEATIESMLRIIGHLGFDCYRVVPSPNGPFGLLQASRRQESNESTNTL